MSTTVNNVKPLKPLSGSQLGMLVAIGSWAMLFGTLILSYMLARARAKVWPPIGSEPVPELLPTLSTLAILLSSVFVHSAFKKLQSSELSAFKKHWWTAIAFALAFTLFQGLAWVQLQDLGFKASSTLYASIVFTLIAFHGLHVVSALSLLFWVVFKPGRAPLYERTQLVGWFWHFLGAVWAVIFICLVWL